MFQFGNSICYQGYRKEHSKLNGTFPSREQVLEDLLILEKDYSYIRIYDTSIHTEDILSIIDEKKLDLKVMLSMYMVVEENHIAHVMFGIIDSNIFVENIEVNNARAKKVIDLANTYKAIVFSISAGNEARSKWNINRVSDKRIAELVLMIKKEVTQPVTFCEEWVYWVDDLKQTAAAVDFISIHSYPVWNDVELDNAIEETSKHFNLIKNQYIGKPIIITEAGWPTKTDENRIPKHWATIENQAIYVNGITNWAKENDTLVFIFEAFDEFWKGSPNENDPEKNWGIYLNNRTKKM